MSKSLNKTQIIGHLGRDPEMKYTASGAAVVNFSVAVSKSWTDSSSGEKREKTTWFRCTAWNKLAEICNQYLAKGSRVYIEGEMESRKYTDKNDIEREVWELVVNDMILLDGRSDRGGNGNDDREEPQRPAPRQAAPEAPQGTRQPMAGQRNAPPPRNVPQPVSDDDDDIPF